MDLYHITIKYSGHLQIITQYTLNREKNNLYNERILKHRKIQFKKNCLI